ncbi:MAG: signal peptidase II [Lachnospiraceae bacterium]|nr:signal peptidase II [Lachnospiraceae bacterium]
MRYVITGLFVFLLDLGVKETIERKESSDVRTFCKGKIRVERYHNKGAMCNVLDDKPKFIRAIHTLVLLWFAVYAIFSMKDHGSSGNKFGMSLLFAGGLSNLYDRYRRGYVVDYLRFKTPWNWLNRMIFNLSDFAIFAGAILFEINSEK